MESFAFAQQPVDYVNPFIGTSNFGTTNPGAVCPQGMDQRLVEDEHARAVHQGAADGELLLHALGELAAQLFALVVELQALEQRVAVAVVLHAVGAADEFEVLLHGQQLVDRWQLGYVSQLALGGQGLVGLAADQDFAGKAQQPSVVLQPLHFP